ncbi:Tn3 family transposase post-transcriptional regulator TnpC [Burkholderia sp. BDU5]|uniref:Tn3 family transposase post-transcriptional regulator TnpC n=1 Tax=Burkholderia sp. BDU5 TaxID=1385590 RepID=UPI00075E6216|nr:Tn3 family transposase post-transcriptional regulator TnpC [Burkholderia sp. BDU5]KVE40075.1 transposase [Burkholderia sp. BDU5]
MSARSAVTTTPYGEVDAASLEKLEATYDTTRMLDAVTSLDEVRASLNDPEGLRDDLLRLHSMAHTILNGASLTVAAQDVPFVDQVSDVIDQIEQYVAELQAIRDVLQSLETLRPGDGNDCMLR